MSWLVISIIVQALLIVHAVRTGRNQIWIWVIALLPGAGALAYIVVEMLPELFGSRTARRTLRDVRKALDPGADLRRYESEAKLTGNVDSRQRYAEELLRQGRHDEAIEVYRQVLSGLYEHDPHLMLGLAQVQFAKGDAAAARATLDELIRLNPDFKSPHGHLLYARALEQVGDVAKAIEEYRVVSHTYPGAEAAVRFSQLLKAQGREEESRQVAQELLDEARVAPAHYRKAQREWLDVAERLAR
jgi:hypothetical protein